MRFLKNFYPNEYAEDVFSIDYESLYRKGFRGLIFDIDNTLVPHGKESTQRVEQLFGNLHSLGFKTLLLSNNSRERVERFNKNIQTSFIHSASKPDIKGFQSALKIMGLSKEITVVIGDTVFTDIAGASKAGIKSILVKYIGYYNTEPKGIKRGIEKFLLKLQRFFPKERILDPITP